MFKVLKKIKTIILFVIVAHCEFLCVKKRDFNDILQETIKQQWEAVENAMNNFEYFRDWDDIAIRECCILAKLKAYATDQTILGDGVGLNSYVYFILKGRCRVIEHLFVSVYLKNGKRIYELYDPNRNVSTVSSEHFISSQPNVKETQTTTREDIALTQEIKKLDNKGSIQLALNESGLNTIQKSTKSLNKAEMNEANELKKFNIKNGPNNLPIKKR